LAKQLTPEQVDIVRRVWEAGGSYREAARRAGCGASTIGAYFPRWRRDKGGDAAPEPIPDPVVDSEITESGDSRTVVKKSRREIRTLEDAVAFAEVDESVWRVKSWGCTAWEQGIKKQAFDAEGKRLPDEFERNTLWRVSLKLERVVSKPLADASELFFERLAQKAPRWSRPNPVPRKTTSGVLAEINIPDLHLGKLCWAPEVGENYDLKIAERVFTEAVEDLWSRVERYDVEEVVFLMGSDHFHVDAVRNTTTAGTQLELDGRYPKMVGVGMDCNARAIELFAARCPRVRAVLVPGNHDWHTAYHLARTIAAYFRHNERVTVDCDLKSRKYVRYGVNLLGYTHGDKIKREKLPLIMAQERAKDWSETTWREFKTGHFHGFKSDEFAGVRVRGIPSLCATDAWHSENGYIGNVRAAEAFIYDREHGFVANYNTIARN
jgi:transposase-like protein